MPPTGLPVEEAARLEADAVLTRLASSAAGLSTEQAARRLRECGPNAVRSHHARALGVLGRQLRSPVLLLLAVTAAISATIGNTSDAIIIGVILLASVALGFVNEYRAERAAASLHDLMRHTVAVLRDGHPARVDVKDVVPGDVVRLAAGVVVPADIRLLEVASLDCDESVLTGESSTVDKGLAPVGPGAGVADLSCCALMGTVVSGGTATGVVVATGARAEFGRIALALGERQPETDFQVGLRQFSTLLLQVAAALTALILLTNLLLHRSLLESLLFSLAIAIGITPQLLPAVVSTSLAVGSRQLARSKVLVKRLVCIEDLGDMDLLVTDKTGTLTDGRVSLVEAVDPGGVTSPEVLALGLLATDVEGDTWTDTASLAASAGNPLDTALWEAAVEGPTGYTRLEMLPFDHERRLTSALVRAPDGSRLLVTKGAPESVLARCVAVPAAAEVTLQARFAAAYRVIAVATRAAGEGVALTAADEAGLELRGFLVLLDQPKASAHETLERLADLGVRVKVATGDNAVVAATVCSQVGVDASGTLTGAQMAVMDDATLIERVRAVDVYARVSPEDKARLIRLLRQDGRVVGFLGDGVNDALALHSADVGLSVDGATDVAREAADIILLEKDLGVIADGVVGGRRIFANTIKYVLMGTSSNFGNMFSAAAASAVLPFLPMLPSQILLNNLLYDSSQLAIPTDRVDPERVLAPSHWDVAFIRRFMVFFGPLSSLFDFMTFAVLLGAFHAGPALFRTGWFIESLATQTLVIFAIRTRRIPFWRSRPSWPLMVAALSVVVVGVLITVSPVSHLLGFTVPPPDFLAVVAVMVLAYLALIEGGKRVFYADHRPPPVVPRARDVSHQVHRRAARFSHRGAINRPGGPGARGPSALSEPATSSRR
ncbi:magnesium-translocating P-type ATPase [Oryzihumus leptocrescens]|uniref:Magnesium-transporting ATPase, P-type 1 n=1 Tax=Oryzihumus leptocrescens TaxID=297536 RepID=A0A542ZI93_9MICO|nr:magnesium-translocating P-type ATPase [Oryzihumus leptocrescens]TQL60009.1 Mg2+-importing ATPase [Oryzihumus leptocrescens]